MILSNLTCEVPDLKVDVVDVPEFGSEAQIMLREMDAISSAEFNEIIKKNRFLENKKTPLFFASLICLCAIDEHGNKISKLEEAEKIASSWNYELLFRVGEKAAVLNGFMGDTVEDTKKPSGKTPDTAQ